MRKLLIEKVKEDGRNKEYFQGWGSSLGLWSDWQTSAYSWNLSDVEEAYKTRDILVNEGFTCDVKEI